MIKRILKWCFSIVMILVVMMTLYIMIFGAIAIKNQRLLTFFGYSYSIDYTGSMAGNKEDSFKQGDFLIINTDQDFLSLEVGDIIAYKNEKNMIITHRIASGNAESGFKMIRDKDMGYDDIIVTEDIFVGKVIKTFHVLGLGLVAVDYRMALVTGIVIVILIIFLYQFFYTVHVSQSEKHERLKEKLQQEMDEEIKNYQASLENDENA